MKIKILFLILFCLLHSNKINARPFLLPGSYITHTNNVHMIALTGFSLMYSRSGIMIVSLPMLLFCYLSIKYFIVEKLFSHLLSGNSIRCKQLCDVLYYLRFRPDPERLRQACSEDNTELALRLVEYGVDPNEAYYYRFGGNDIGVSRKKVGSALELACYHGNREVVDALLSAGADINATGYFRTTALFYACSTAKGLSLFKYLIEKGAYARCRRCCNCVTNYPAADLLIQPFLTSDIENVVEILSTIIDALFDKRIPYKKIHSSLFDIEENKEEFDGGDGCWFERLCSELYRCIKDAEQREALLLKLFQHKDFTKPTFEAALIHDDRHFIEKIINKDYFQRMNLRYLSHIGKHHSKNVLAYLYDYYNNNDIESNSLLIQGHQNMIWQTAALYSDKCLQHLLSLSKDPLQELQRKNEYCQTVFYTAVTHDVIKDINDFECLRKNVTFLEEEMHRVVAIKESTNVGKFIKFCVAGGAQIMSKDETDVCAVEKAKKRLMNYAETLADNVQVCSDLCFAFKSVLSDTDKKIFFPHATT